MHMDNFQECPRTRRFARHTEMIAFKSKKEKHTCLPTEEDNCDCRE